MLALALQQDEIDDDAEIAVDLLGLAEHEHERTQPAANDPHYLYVRTLAFAPPRPVRVPAPILYEEFHPYGSSAYRAVSSAIEVSAKRYRYAGKERDEETGLDHMGARYYAGWLGRWTSADPIGLGDGVNRYAYVRGNPVGMRDPSGTAATGRPTQEEITQYEQAAEAHNTAVQTWHAEVATFDPEAKNAEYTRARLEGEGSSLVQREGELWSQWEDLATRNIQADIQEQHEREFEEGNPESLVSPRTLVRVGGAAKISFGVTLALGGGVVGGVLAADFLQAGGRQSVSGEDSSTAIRGVTELVSEASGSSVREARIHGDIAETLVPAGYGALRVGAAVAGPTAAQLEAREAGRFMAQGFSEQQARYLAQPYPSSGMGEHFFPRRLGSRLGIPRAVMDSEFNVLRPQGISRGGFYELHYRVDPYFRGARLPRSVGGGSWSGQRLGLERASGPMKFWLGTPRAFKLGLVLGGTAAGSTALERGTQ